MMPGAWTAVRPRAGRGRAATGRQRRVERGAAWRASRRSRRWASSSSRSRHGLTRSRGCRRRVAVRISIDETAAEHGALGAGRRPTPLPEDLPLRWDLRPARRGDPSCAPRAPSPTWPSTLDGPLGVAAAVHAAGGARLARPGRPLRPGHARLFEDYDDPLRRAGARSPAVRSPASASSPCRARANLGILERQAMNLREAHELGVWAAGRPSAGPTPETCGSRSPPGPGRAASVSESHPRAEHLAGADSSQRRGQRAGRLRRWSARASASTAGGRSEQGLGRSACDEPSSGEPSSAAAIFAIGCASQQALARIVDPAVVETSTSRLDALGRGQGDVQRYAFPQGVTHSTKRADRARAPPRRSRRT